MEDSGRTPRPEARAALAASLEGWRAVALRGSAFRPRTQGDGPAPQRQFSVGRLMEFLNRLGQDVRITVRPTRKAQGEMEVVVG